MRSKYLWLGLLAVLWVLASVVVGEFALRWFSKDKLPIVLDERNLTYRFDQRLGWFPREDSEGILVDANGILIHYHHNHEGFRDREHGEKRGKRVAFIGDSFVWGFDVEAPERFTDKVQAGLPDWEVFNLGVSGYGTDQEFLLLVDVFQRVNPDVVILLFCPNDYEDNAFNQRYGGYYKPYFERVGNTLQLKGVPVPKSVNYYYSRFPRLAIRSCLFRGVLTAWSRLTQPKVVMQKGTTFALLHGISEFVRSRSATLVVSSVTYDPAVEAFCKNEGIPYVKLPNIPYNKSWHWNPEGHTTVARVFLDSFAQSGNFGAGSKSGAIESPPPKLK